MVRREGRGKGDKPRRRQRTNDDSSTCLNGINESLAQQPINTCLHQKHQTEGTSRPLLSRHVPDVNPCNTNPNAHKRPTHPDQLHHLQSQPPRPEPPPLSQIIFPLQLPERGSPPELMPSEEGPLQPHHRHPDVVEPTPKFHHPRKPPRDRRDRPHLMSHHPLISHSPGRGSERRPSARTRGLSQTKVDRRRSFRWPVCATGASTRRFGSHFVCGRSGVRCRRRDCGARRDRGGSWWVGVGWWVFGVGGGW